MATMVGPRRIAVRRTQRSPGDQVARLGHVIARQRQVVADDHFPLLAHVRDQRPSLPLIEPPRPVQ
jgi:hypothetical protein